MKNLLLLFAPLMARAYQWCARNNSILLNDQAVRIKGINWYGLETELRSIEGLWSHPISFYVESLHSQGFNALRIPIAEQMMLYDASPVPSNTVSQEPRAINGTPMNLLDLIFDEAKKKNMLVLIDVHRLRYRSSSPLWYIPSNMNYSRETLLTTLDTLVERYKHYPNFMGVDLYNEPHYQADYGSNNMETDWRLFIQDCADFLLHKHPDHSFLLFVNGIDWGKNLSQYGANPPSLPDSFTERIVLSPHEYGPTLTRVPSFEKSVLYGLWDSLFGYLRWDGRFALCIGEWGGRFDYAKEKVWLDTFADYMIENGLTNNFFWALNPFSKDVRGLMVDWDVFSEEKLAFLERIQPSPSVFQIEGEEIYATTTGRR